MPDKRVLNFVVIAVLTTVTFAWTFFVFHASFDFTAVLAVIITRMAASVLILKDYSLSWSKATPKTFLIKSVVNIAAFAVYMPFFYTVLPVSLMVSELMLYLFAINFLVYSYHYYNNKSKTSKNAHVVIYGAGQAGLGLEHEFKHSQYKVTYFVDDNTALQKRSVDSIPIIGPDDLKEKLDKRKSDLLVIAIPSAPKKRITQIYNQLHPFFKQIKILPTLDEILQNKGFSDQLKDISVEDLLARHPKDLDKKFIEGFIKNKKVLVTGAGGSIGGEISRQCVHFGAKKLILVDHSEYNLYTISQELESHHPFSVMASVVDKESLEEVFEAHKPDIVIHAAAYKHVPLVENNITQALKNNILGTKNTIDLAVKHGVHKFVLISTDKAVNPTNVMGASKRICELYAQNCEPGTTEIVAVRFGNVLGSSGSVIPKFKSQLKKGGPLTVTHPDITRYFMLIPEACELVLQAASLGKGGEIFILDMGKPVKIADLAQKMIELSGQEDIEITYTGLRPGEKLYEELIIEGSEEKTRYESIMIASKSYYEIAYLKQDIQILLSSSRPKEILQKIIPEYGHRGEKQ